MGPKPTTEPLDFPQIDKLVARTALRAAQVAYRKALEERAHRIALALKADIPITEVSEETGLSRTTTYKAFRPTN